jgi:hypothetical protein
MTKMYTFFSVFRSFQFNINSLKTIELFNIAENGPTTPPFGTTLHKLLFLLTY